MNGMVGSNKQHPCYSEKTGSIFGKLPAFNCMKTGNVENTESVFGKVSVNQVRIWKKKILYRRKLNEKEATWNTAWQFRRERRKKMFYSIKGTLIHMEPGFAVVDCNGVGFKCFTTLNTQRSLRVGEVAMLYTHMNVREDAMDLFGFATQSELNCFKLLTAVSGVGPKVGLAILSELLPEQVAVAASRGDSKAFTRASGVGPKLAERIVLELRDKVKKMTASMPDFKPGTVLSAAGNAENAVNALAVLGYTPTDAAEVVARFDSALPTEELIRLSLREMGRGR